jgi:hypothetical protein
VCLCQSWPNAGTTIVPLGTTGIIMGTMGIIMGTTGIIAGRARVFTLGYSLEPPW